MPLRMLQKTGDDGRAILSPSALAARVQASFDANFGLVWVEGEVSEMSVPYSGHAYFCLKDREAKIKAVMWRSRFQRGGAALVEGQTVLARGRLAVYAPQGVFQLIVEYAEPRGEGALRLAYEKLKAKLGQEGLFDEGRKRPLPYWPGRVAVISSRTGAAACDFIRTAKKRCPAANICLYPARVQGPGAAQEIAAALEDLNVWGGFDLIVLTRGGGSLTDLWCFNEETVARAVAASRTPTLAAIGHSTDLSLAELAADGRAITPTAAAEAAFPDQVAVAAYLGDLRGRALRAVALLLEAGQTRLGDLTGRLSALERLAGQKGQDLDYAARELGRAMLRRLTDEERRLELLSSRLNDLSPLTVLQRGFAVVTTADGGRPVTSAADVAVGEGVAVRLAQGRFLALVKEICHEEKD